MEFVALEFLNSDWHDWHGSGLHIDRLEQPAWIADFLAQWQLKIDPAVDEAAQTALKELRGLLRRLLETLVAGRSLAAADVAALNHYLSLSAFKRQLNFEAGGQQLRPELRPVQKDWDWALAELANSFAELITQHDTERLRICRNPDCGWIFYDSSRNKTRRWCEDSTCGSLNRVRRFRQRQKATPDPTGLGGSKMV